MPRCPGLVKACSDLLTLPCFLCHYAIPHPLYSALEVADKTAITSLMLALSLEVSLSMSASLCIVLLTRLVYLIPKDKRIACTILIMANKLLSEII